MHISKFWATGAQTLYSLRLACISLSIAVFALGGLLFLSNGKKPLLIERSCTSRIVPTSSDTFSPQEIESFLLEAVPARFDSKDQRIDLLSLGELKRKVDEQKKFSRKKIDQRMLIDEVRFTGDAGGIIEISTTRLISVENVRSAFPFSLQVRVEKTYRSESNPYGLLLTDVKEIKPSEVKETK